MSVSQNATPDDGSRYVCDLCTNNRFVTLAGLTNHYYFFHHKTLPAECAVKKVFKKVLRQKTVYDPARRKKKKAGNDIGDASDSGSDDEVNNQNNENSSNMPQEPKENRKIQIVATRKIAGKSIDATVLIYQFTMHHLYTRKYVLSTIQDTPDVLNQPSRLLLQLLQSNLIEKELHTQWLRARRDCYMAMFDAECNLLSAYTYGQLESTANDDAADLINSSTKLKTQIANFDAAFINLMNDINKLRDDAANLSERICTSIDKAPIVKEEPENNVLEPKAGSDGDVDE